jgi:flagellar biosynthesis GTPase FlhF
VLFYNKDFSYCSTIEVEAMAAAKRTALQLEKEEEARTKQAVEKEKKEKAAQLKIEKDAEKVKKDAEKAEKENAQKAAKDAEKATKENAQATQNTANAAKQTSEAKVQNDEGGGILVMVEDAKESPWGFSAKDECPVCKEPMDNTYKDATRCKTCNSAQTRLSRHMTTHKVGVSVVTNGMICLNEGLGMINTYSNTCCMICKPFQNRWALFVLLEGHAPLNH